jgi:hypothetical protein
MARILFVIELSDEENRPRIATDLAASLRAQFGSARRAAMAVGVTRQAFYDWLAGHPVAMKHFVAMTALLAIGDQESLGIATDDATDTPTDPDLPLR